MRKHLIIFTRAPQLGRVKRRLASEIGASAALRFHRAMQAQLLRGPGSDRRWKTWIAITPDIRTRNNENIFLNQGQGDLGRRMAKAFRALPPGPAVLVGSDIPGMNSRHIARAFAELGRKDVVFGPARDGGYWLAGLKRVRALGGPHGKTLFTGVRWSTAHALSDSCAAYDRPSRISLIDCLSDVDTAEDYHHWRRLCSSSRGMISTKLQGLKR